jgi:uncharacterized protein YdeI (YjbR/CyaY-like superfamily)
MATKRPPKAELDALAFATQKDWAAWLKAHHASSPGLWVRMAKKGTGVASIKHAEALEEALCYGWIDGQARSEGAEWWRIRFVPRTPRSVWSKINRESVLALIEAGRMKPAGLKEIERAKADGRWAAAYASQRTIEVPEDLQAALARNARAKAHFAKLDSRNRYAILLRTHNAKRPETRARRIAQFVEMLAKGETIHPPMAARVKR